MDKLASLTPEKWALVAENPSTYPFAGDPRLSSECHVRSPLSEVWEFFSRPKNVRELTPPSYETEIIAGDGDSPVKPGRNVTFRSRVLGMHQDWPTYIPWVYVGEKRAGFVDIRVEGVFRRWCHLHRFEALPGGGTRILDEVRWCLAVPRPLAFAGDLVVEQQLRTLMRYRKRRLDEMFHVTRSSG